MLRSILVCLSLFLSLHKSNSWQVSPLIQSLQRATPRPTHLKDSSTLLFSTKSPPEAPPEKTVEETTEKYGLEAGLFESLKKDDGGESAKSLLKKYGVAYLATSIPLALVSFALCYLLVDNGVDVQGLLMKIGIGSETANSDAAEKAGTVAIAYAAHKAASPIRFPPTVLLTPVVAKLLGKEPNSEDTVEP